MFGLGVSSVQALILDGVMPKHGLQRLGGVMALHAFYILLSRAGETDKMYHGD